MANEGSAAITLTATKNGVTMTQSVSYNFSMTGDDLIDATQLIGFAASELLVFGEITGAPQKLLIKNLDTTNYVEIGGDAGLTVFKIKIPAGEACLIQPTSANVYAQANTAAVRVLVKAVEA